MPFLLAPDNLKPFEWLEVLLGIKRNLASLNIRFQQVADVSSHWLYEKRAGEVVLTIVQS
jgi:hypothetical protein